MRKSPDVIPQWANVFKRMYSEAFENFAFHYFSLLTRIASKNAENLVLI